MKLPGLQNASVNPCVVNPLQSIFRKIFLKHLFTLEINHLFAAYVNIVIIPFVMIKASLIVATKKFDAITCHVFLMS